MNEFVIRTHGSLSEKIILCIAFIVILFLLVCCSYRLGGNENLPAETRSDGISFLDEYCFVNDVLMNCDILERRSLGNKSSCVYYASQSYQLYRYTDV